MIDIRLEMQQFKLGDRIIWRHSPGRSFLAGWRVKLTPGVIVRVCPRRLRIRVHLRGREMTVNVDPENVLTPDEVEELKSEIQQGKNIQPLQTPELLAAQVLPNKLIKRIDKQNQQRYPEKAKLNP